MGVLNVTPDSFSDGGEFLSCEDALQRAKQMVLDGADIIDIGGESTRPGSDQISEEEELERVLPVIRELIKEVSVPLSIDTYKPQVAEACLRAGVSMINDITGLANEEMRRIVAEHNVPVVIMHMLGTPKMMQENPVYEDVVLDIKNFFQERIALAREAGIGEVIIDPGIGFGKTTAHNLELLRRLDEFSSLGVPIMVGPSRKSFIGRIAGLPPDQRVEGTIAALSFAVSNSVSMVRVHDVRECKIALQVLNAKSATVFIGIGSNMGYTELYIDSALKLIRERCDVIRVSSLYDTEPVGYENQAWFLNGAAEIQTTLSPHELLQFLQSIETRLNRTRTIRFGSRTIDLDILSYDNLVIHEENLIVPHPRMHERAFVLTPLGEICPDFIHPISGKTIHEMQKENPLK